MITAGNKIARAGAIRVVESKNKGTKSIEVMFAFDENGVPARLYWNGWLTPGALENTLKTLIEVLDYNGDETVVTVPAGDPREGMFANQDCINLRKDVQLVVEMESWEGKERPRIKWVNNISGGQFGGCSPEVVKSHFGAIGFKATYLSVKQGAPQVKQPDLLF